MNLPIEPREYLIQFLQTFPQISNDLIDELSRIIPVQVFQKGDLLVKEGEVPQECFFVLKGMVRQYHFIDGLERTTEFYTESKGTVSSVHFTQQTPSEFCLVCEEESILIVGNNQIDQKNLERFPLLNQIIAKILEADLNEMKQVRDRFILSSPKERYENFLKERPDLNNRVPLHQIASVLGLTPESLSRIRRRLVKN